MAYNTYQGAETQYKNMKLHPLDVLGDAAFIGLGLVTSDCDPFNLMSATRKLKVTYYDKAKLNQSGPMVQVAMQYLEKAPK